MKIGIIGYGERIAYMAAQLAQFRRGVHLAAIADPRAGAIARKNRRGSRTPASGITPPPRRCWRRRIWTESW